MAINSRSNTIMLIAGGAIIAVALLLFVNALSIRDFSQPGQELFSGRSDLRLVLAFALLTGLALVLLMMILRTARSAGNSSAAAERRMREKDDPKRIHTQEKTALPAEAIEATADAASEIISDTAGELRSTIEVMQEELEEILEEEAPADKEHMQSLYDETDRLKKIIASMEQLSQAQAIAHSLKKEPLQIELLLKDIIEKARLAVPDRDITYTLECDPGIAMLGDAECIRRILGNITDNAARFIKDSGTVTLSAARAGGMAVFSVRDTGTGIRRAHLSHLYERFFRGTGSGIGMGLSIVKELVDACGGKIEVQSAVGKGTTFTVQLPAE